MLKTQIKSTPAYKKQLGMTFIEVLVAFVILATGILGAVAMQAGAKQSSFEAMQRSLASSLAQDMIARIRANSAANIADYISNEYGTNFNPNPDPMPNRCKSATVFCTPAQITANDIYEWQLALVGADVISDDDGLRGGLVGGQGCIIQSGNGLEVVVSWQGRSEMIDSQKSEDCGTSGNKKRRQVVVQAFII